MSLKIQILTIVTMAACGATMGLLYDSYRVMKGQTGLRGWLVIICDLLFWASCTFLVFGTLLRINEGIVRLYLFLAMGVGVWIYFIVFHSLYIKWFLKLIQWVKATYQFIIKLIRILMIKPMIWLHKLLIMIIVAIALFIWKLILGIHQFLMFLFSPLIKWTGHLVKRIYFQLRIKTAGILRYIAKLFKKKSKK